MRAPAIFLWAGRTAASVRARACSICSARRPSREPRHVDAIIEAELDHALGDPDPLRGIALHGQPIDELALALLDMDDPAQSSFLRLIGPPGAGKSQIARAIAYRLWTGRGRDVTDRHGAPFYGFGELQPGPSSDEFFFRYDYVPVAGAGGQVQLVDSAFVQAMHEGWVVMIDEVNTARDVALLSINATLDGRLTLYLAATGETVVARPQLTARLGAAFMLDPAGVTRTKALGSERMASKLRDALPGGVGALRAAVWAHAPDALACARCAQS